MSSLFSPEDERWEKHQMNKPRGRTDLPKTESLGNLTTMFHATFEKLGFSPNNIEFQESGEDMHVGPTPMQYKDNE